MIRSIAPLRISLAGGGSDVSPYCDKYGGEVLNATINHYAHCTIIPNSDGKIRFYALDIQKEVEHRLSNELPYYILPLHSAVYNRIIRDFTKGKMLSFDMYTQVDCPPGSGLGSSSALVVAMLMAYCEWLNIPLGKYELAHIAYEIERIDLGYSGGKQDQYASVFGGMNHILFGENDRVIVNPLGLKDSIVYELQESLLLCYTQISRDSSVVIDNQRNKIIENDPDAVKATLSLVENVGRMRKAITQYNICKIAEVLNDSWENKKRIADNITNTNIDVLYSTCVRNGALAGKISGAGNGGFMMLLVNPLTKNVLKNSLHARLEKVRFLPFTFDHKGAVSWTL